MNWIFGVVIIAILIKMAVQLALEAMNRVWAIKHKDKLPEHLKGIVTPEAHAKSAEYTLEHNRLGGIEMIYGTFIKIGILSCGILPLIYNATILKFGAGNFWAQALMMTLLSIAIGILFWPFDLIGTFGIEAKYGFNRQTPWLWISDELKGFALNIILTVPLMAAVLWMSTGAIKNWWLWAFIVVMIYEIILTFIYPNFIEPLFNKFEPLKDGALKTRLEALATRAGVNVEKILVMDASKRSAHANAYFAGLGGSRRIVLYDTLLKQLGDEEIEAVLAHEIGHMKHQHILRGMFVGGALQLLGFFLTNLIIHWGAFYRAFGLAIEGGNAGAFLVLEIIGGVFVFWLTPVMSRWHRLHEYEADAMAVKLVGSPMPLVLGLKKLTKESLASIEDHPASHAFYAGHPTVKEREERMKSKSKRRLKLHPQV
jgi:STE24 endopeptidase